MHETPNSRPELIVPIGTQVVLRFEVDASGESDQFQKGTVAEVVRAPLDSTHSYGLRCPDGRELSLNRQEFSILKQVKSGPVGDLAQVLAEYDLHRFVIYQCVVGSRAYGLSRDESDVDRRGIYLPPVDLHWSIYGVPEQLEDRDTDECYWELQKFMVLALKANPNILECLYTPIVEKTSEIGDSLLTRREIFLSKLVYQTYNGYVMSQFRKLEQDLRNHEEPSWKHAMHLIRLLLQGISLLNEQRVPVNVESHRTELLSIRDGKMSWDEVNRWRLALHREFEDAYRDTRLPDSPDYAEANRILIGARRKMVEVSL
ncbi:MAG: nucleotidyltransferase domain-containing protein [Acidobacteriaceae bacterium]